jgi:hypothetical protein
MGGLVDFGNGDELEVCVSIERILVGRLEVLVVVALVVVVLGISVDLIGLGDSVFEAIVNEAFAEPAVVLDRVAAV